MFQAKHRKNEAVHISCTPKCAPSQVLSEPVSVLTDCVRDDIKIVATLGFLMAAEELDRS